MTTKDPFSEWVYEEMRQRSIDSVRAFAAFVGLSHGTFNNLLDPKKRVVKYPRLDTIIKISKATNTDLCTLMALIAPDATRIDPEIYIIAQRISRLPIEQQQVVDRWLLGQPFEVSQQSK